MKQVNPAPALAAIILLTLLGSCKKEIDYIGQHYDQLTPYRIATFSYTRPYGGTDTLRFSYDQWGNPTKITRPIPATGYPDFEFRYDRNHRLTDFIGVYSFSDTTNGEFWHRYFYNSRGLITKDSVFIFPYIVNGQLSTYIYPRLIQLGYDDRGRVNIEINAYGGNDTIHYEYDAKGNLIGGTYDNKLSFRQTNRIWMFLDRDYSLNNRFIADSYYAGLLPLHIGLQAEEVYPLYFLYDGYFTTADITYTLK